MVPHGHPSTTVGVGGMVGRSAREGGECDVEFANAARDGDGDGNAVSNRSYQRTPLELEETTSCAAGDFPEGGIGALASRTRGKTSFQLGAMGAGVRCGLHGSGLTVSS